MDDIMHTTTIFNRLCKYCIYCKIKKSRLKYFKCLQRVVGIWQVKTKIKIGCTTCTIHIHEFS
jgi:hypothetical protein